MSEQPSKNWIESKEKYISYAPDGAARVHVTPLTAGGKGAKTPAPKEDQVKGSDTNKKGSASGTKAARSVKFSARVEKALQNKVEEHNKTAKKGRKASLGMLKAVYRRGAGAYSTSHRPGKTRDQWAMARVNAFLRLLKSGKPSNSAYTTDNDLLPAGHPKSSKKDNSAVTASGVSAEDIELTITIPENNTYDQPEDAILALTEFSGLGYEAEPAIRASWLRAVKRGDNPYVRAKHLAEGTYQSLDADLLPAQQEGQES